MDIKALLDEYKIPYNQLFLHHQALTHRSYVNETSKDLNDYERLEFMGDAVLDLIVTTYLFRHYPDYDEGKMTALRAKIVREESLATYAREMDLGQYMKLGNGEEKNGGRNRDSVLANVFEALLGAIYLDAGLEAAWIIIDTIVIRHIEEDNFGHLKDFKTTLQELIQADTRQSVIYEIVEKTGPSNAPKFRVVVKMGNLILGEGISHTKKKAEQQAAKAALEKMAKS